jgi:hypothetical protein
MPPRGRVPAVLPSGPASPLQRAGSEAPTTVRFDLQAGAKKSSHRRGRNLWKPWSRGIFAPMVPIILQLCWERKDIPQKFSHILRKSGWTGENPDVYMTICRRPGSANGPPQRFSTSPVSRIVHNTRTDAAGDLHRGRQCEAVSSEVPLGSPANRPRAGSRIDRCWNLPVLCRHLHQGVYFPTSAQSAAMRPDLRHSRRPCCLDPTRRTSR